MWFLTFSTSACDVIKNTELRNGHSQDEPEISGPLYTTPAFQATSFKKDPKIQIFLHTVAPNSYWFEIIIIYINLVKCKF